MLTVERITNRDQWNDTLKTLPYAHVLQTWEWGEFKQATTGWQPHRLAFKRDNQVVAMASVLIRSIGPLKVMYIPKGPAVDYSDMPLLDELFTHLRNVARAYPTVWLKLDPDVVIATGVPGEEDDTTDEQGENLIGMLKLCRWRFSGEQVQFRNTITIDLTLDEEALLAQMSQNTRRKVRTGQKKGVTIREGTTDDLQTLYDLYQITGQRDDFLTRPLPYYEQAWRSFMEAGLAHALIAEVDGQAIAHVILFHFGRKCWYFYGASSNEARETMPNYALQWEAMRWAKAHGYALYDMWGAPDEFDENDPLWGVYEFKRGFRGTVTRHIGAWDYTPNRLVYWGYTRLWPYVLIWMRQTKT